MTCLRSRARALYSGRGRRTGLLAGLLAAAVLTVGGAAAAELDRSSAGISAHLSSTSFTRAQAGSVKLSYRFSRPSASFAYLLSYKKGSKWQTIKRVNKRGVFKGSKSTKVKMLFAGKPIKLGSYRLKLSADAGSKRLSFRVVTGGAKGGAATPPVDTNPPQKPTVDPPANTALPSISGKAVQGQTLSTSSGSWSGSPSYGYQWRRCNFSGGNCEAIAGATASSYVLRAVDVARTIQVAVTASNSGGSAGATSAQTAIVAGSSSETAGSYHSCVVLSSGTVSCWGNNGDGKLGDGTVTGAVSVAAGGTQTCAVLNDGTIKCWGSNSNGQLGNSTTTGGATPVTVSGITNARTVSAGTDHSCAVLSDGTVKCWGLNSYGQLGNSGTATKWTPVEVSGITDAVAVSGGWLHTCALLSGGTVKCWGSNYFGQLGNGNRDNSSTPSPVSGIANAVGIGAGYYHSCAVLGDGTVQCWGANGSGQLGDGLTDHDATVEGQDVSLSPVTVSGIANALTISAGRKHSYVLLSSGVNHGWGENAYGQLGDH